MSADPAASTRAVPRATLSPAARREEIRAALDATRQRTHLLIGPLSDEAAVRQHSPLMSPIVWDLGHIAAFEELWLVENLGAAVGESALEPTYDATRTPRARRGSLRLPDRGAALERLAAVRERALARLEDADLGSENPLLRCGYVWELVREHEAQHQETILQTLLLMEGESYRPAGRRPLPGGPAPEAPPPGSWVRIPEGPFRMGAPEDGRFAYDNERPSHTVRLPAFEIGVHPVTAGEWAEFIAAGGYADPRLWSQTGWAWRVDSGPVAPGYWRPAAGAGALSGPAEAAERTRSGGLSAWRHVTSLGEMELHPDAPVVHVCAHEADAYARFRGARLPTEAEWEKAAAWDPEAEESRRWPWGDAREPSGEWASLDQLGFGVTPVGAHPQARSAAGCWGMLGDVWEWTSSPFAAYPGFRAFPYEEYSAVFFGEEYRVLRGASWATAACAARATFRNWDYPIRRQIFAGLRLARDA